MKNIFKSPGLLVCIVALCLFAVWVYKGRDDAMLLASIVTCLATIAAVIVVVVGWRRSLKLQRNSNRDLAKLEAMKQYQQQLQDRYEKMLEMIAPFVSSMQTYSSLIGFSGEVSNTQLKTFFEGLHTDAKDLEKGILPYYLTLMSNTFFDDDLVSRHAQSIDRLSTEIRDILGHPLIPKSNGVTIQTFVTLNNLQNEFISESYMFMRAVGQQIKHEIDSYED